MLHPPYRRPRPLPEPLAARAEDVTIEGSTLPIRVWLIRPDGVARGTMLFVHGWSSDGSRMAALATPLVEAGFAVMLADLPGHGRTGPVETYNGKLMVDDLALIRGWMSKHPDRTPEPFAILGYSFGGLGAYVSAARDPVWRAIVLMAAPIGPMQATRLYFDGMRLPGALLVRLLRPSLVRLVGVDPDTFEGPRSLSTVRVPVLIVHGENDEVVPVSHADGLAASVPAGLGTVVRVPGGDHNSLMADAAVGARIASFVAASLEVRR
jgi:hypothetical protein